MADYTEFKRGSEWRKWDLHIHTPETKKNDQFEGSTPEEKWENYIGTINSSPEEICVVGVTDYFCIENYFKFKKFIEDGKIKKQFDLVLPNVELRVLPVTGSATPINLHCIFNPDIENEIETRFLAKLKFDFSGSNFSAKKEELIRLGRAMPDNDNLDEISAYKAGVGQYVISVSVLKEIFEKDNNLRSNTIIVVSNKSREGVTGIISHSDFFTSTNQSQLNATRWSIYQFSDAIFSSNENDIQYFVGLGPDNKETVLQKCGALKPCFHGSDAHKNGDIFKPYDNRYCWIKADPTFEGLKQTLYEPEDRVRIQALKPDVKNERHVISELKFLDTNMLFGNQVIQLNENLNAIIGGKSSGKSLLLFSAANSIDPEQVDKTSKRLNFEGYNFGQPYDFEVIWKNGEKDTLKDPSNKTHKITYIPQLYINYLVERNNKEDLNSLVENILLQDTSFKQFYEQKKNEIAITTSEIESLLTDYLLIRIKGLELQQKSKDLGQSEAISKSIEKLKLTIAEGQKTSTLSKEEFADYSLLVTEKATSEKLFKDWEEKELVLNKILFEVTNSRLTLFGMISTIDSIPIKGKIDRLLDEMTMVPEEIKTIKLKLENDFDVVIKNLEDEIQNLNISTRKQEIGIQLKTIDEKLKPYMSKIAGQKDLQKLTVQLENEKQKMLQAQNLEKQLKTLLEDYSNIRNRTVNLLKKRYDFYKQIVKVVNETRNDIGSEITLKCYLLMHKDEFPLFEQANRAAIPNENIFHSLFSSDYVNYEQVIKLYENPLRVNENRLLIDNDKNIPLKIKTTLEEVLRGVIIDSFKLDYSVTYKGDDLLSMSPGKKGTVLLILFLQINSSEYPILIDQPEDNLDNRTIYDLLCKMIKWKKKERQIVIVSHNANLVVATDTENIIVANQEGQDLGSSTEHFRFEYVNGSLEHTFPRNLKIKGILQQQGIKEHVCDVLEGGDEAFKQREKKYSIK